MKSTKSSVILMAMIAALLCTIAACGGESVGGEDDGDAEVEVLEEDGAGDLTAEDGRSDDGTAEDGSVEDLDAVADDGAEGDPVEDGEGEGDVVEEDAEGDDGDGGCAGCIIAGACFEDGTPAPGNICLVCDAEREAEDWSGNDGASCEDDVFCNGADTCLGGACEVHAGDPCADDGLFCNGAESCDETGGACTSSGDPCTGPDGDEDCAESCDETLDDCMAYDPDGSACDDGLYCNGTDSCDLGLCVPRTGDPCPGPDGDEDCAESCDEMADSCTANDPARSACDDGLYCNGADFCSIGACDTHMGDPCPGSDGDGDCAESCDETADSCTANDLLESLCDDGTFCNGYDGCDGLGACSMHEGDPCAGNVGDGDANCAESCNETNDSCTANDPNGSACSDGLYCNGTDSCSSGACGTHAGSPCPGPDGDANCAESCNETSDNCTASDPNGSVCGDGLFCNGTDTCISGACGTHMGNPCPGPDGDVNCAESCNETSDNCTASDPNSSACSDGIFCNGVDRCVSGACNGHTGYPCPGPDGDFDCRESCDEFLDNCLANDPDGSFCFPGLLMMCNAGVCL